MMTIAPDGSQVLLGNSIFTTTANTGTDLSLMGIGSNGSATTSRVYDGVFNKPPQPTITAGSGVSVSNPDYNTFEISSTASGNPNITAGANIDVKNPSPGNYNVSALAPAWAFGTTSSNRNLYFNPSFGSSNVAITLSPYFVPGVYLFKFIVANSTGTTQIPLPVNYQPNPSGSTYSLPVSGGYIQFYISGSGINSGDNTSVCITSFDAYQVVTPQLTPNVLALKQEFFVFSNSNEAYILNIRPYDNTGANNTSIWNVTVQVQAIYLGSCIN